MPTVGPTSPGSLSLACCQDLDNTAPWWSACCPPYPADSLGYLRWELMPPLLLWLLALLVLEPRFVSVALQALWGPALPPPPHLPAFSPGSRAPGPPAPFCSSRWELHTGCCLWPECSPCTSGQPPPSGLQRSPRRRAFFFFTPTEAAPSLPSHVIVAPIFQGDCHCLKSSLFTCPFFPTGK